MALNKIKINDTTTVNTGVVYDISKATSQSYDSLSAALGTNGNNVPLEIREGGMTVRFVSNSDNKYVQYRLLTNEFTTDTTQWAIADEGVYVENPEYVYVKTDAEGKILWAIKIDGGIYYGAGVPQQIIDYIEEKLEELSLDEYEDIVAFLSDYLGSDTTLKVMIDGVNAQIATKVDKIEGKSIIDAEYADGVSQAENPEFVYVKTDADDKILYGVKQNGNFYFGAGTPSQIQEELNNKIDYTDFIDLTENKVDKEEGKSLIDEEVSESLSAIEDPEGRSEITIDDEGKIISYRDSDGIKHEEAGIETDSASINHLNLTDTGMTEFQKALKDSGFQAGGKGDWSDYISNNGNNPLNLPLPNCGYINIISDKDLTKLSKRGRNDAIKGANFDIPTEIEYFDYNGNYFKKWALISAQGNSSMAFTKKNISIDLFDSSVYDEEGSLGDGDAFAIKFGNWVPFDSYHLKAFATDFFKGVSVVAYQLANDVDLSYDVTKNRNWKRALLSAYNITDNPYSDNIKDLSLQTDNGARCMPDGFPVIVYQNGAFYGIFAMMIKKHRDNYCMNKKEPKHVHLDGTLSGSTLFNGTIDWTAFEVRNPKNLVYASAHTYTEKGKEETTYKYDADLPGQFEIAGNSDGSTTYTDWSVGSYQIGVIRKHNGHLFMNVVDGNTAEPIYNEKNNGDDAPDFKNKTGCGWINVTNTVKVKEYIISLSNRVAEINVAETDEKKKNIFETYFDKENFVDYALIQSVVWDGDSTGKNWQWTTWDGIRWYVNEYDKDLCFGGSASGAGLMSAIGNIPESQFPIINDGYFPNPAMFIKSLYYNDLKLRYKELKDLGIFTTENIISKISNWVNRIGLDNFKKEYEEKWINSSCCRTPNVDSHWIITYCDYNAYDDSAYNNEQEYNINDTCYVNLYGLKFHFKAKEATKGNNPLIISYPDMPIGMGYRDSLWRIYEYIKKSINTHNTWANRE